MDPKFHPALAAVRSGDLGRFRAIIEADPALATARSSSSHPTLLQAVALDGNGKPNNVEMARILIDAGAPPDEPLVAAASINNAAVAELLLEHGGAIDGTGGWSPLEEALYWNSGDTLALLLERGARVRNLRIAAGLGYTDRIAEFFEPDGALKPEAGRVGSAAKPASRQVRDLNDAVRLQGGWYSLGTGRPAATRGHSVPGYA